MSLRGRLSFDERSERVPCRRGVSSIVSCLTFTNRDRRNVETVSTVPSETSVVVGVTWGPGPLSRVPQFHYHLLRLHPTETTVVRRVLTDP